MASWLWLELHCILYSSRAILSPSVVLNLKVYRGSFCVAMFGVGVDITHVPRIARLVTRWGVRFLRRAFAPAEIARYEELLSTGSGPSPAMFLASRWAAKEALHKAVVPRLGIRLDFAEVEICRQPTIAGSLSTVSGPPAFSFHGKAAAALKPFKLEPSLSLSHDGEYAIAFVVVPSQQVPPLI